MRASPQVLGLVVGSGGCCPCRYSLQSVKAMALVSEQHELPEPALRPPRFSLRTLWIVITALCCLFAVMASLSALWSAMLLLFLCLITAHVLGNSLGTKLRDHTNQQIRVARATRPQRVAAAIASGVAAPEQLTRRSKLKRITLVMTIGGAMIGAEFGGLGLAALYPRASVPAVTLGVISSAVLGGFAGFLASSFLSVVREALAEAHRGAAVATRQTVAADPTSRDVRR